MPSAACMSVTLKLKPDVGEDVLVVVAGGQVAEAALEAAPADAVDAGRAPAVAPPLAQRAERAEPARVVGDAPRRPRPSSCGGRDRTSRSPQRRTCPTWRPPMREPSASQQSSISTRPCSRQSASTPGPSNGLPSVWARTTPRVRGADRRGDRLERRVVGVRLDVDVDRHETVLVEPGATVVGKPTAAVITSSPGASGRSCRCDSRRGDGEQVRLRAGADEHRVLRARSRRARPSAERIREPPLGQRGVQDGLGRRGEVLGVEHLGGDGHARRARLERLLGQRRRGVRADRLQRAARSAASSPSPAPAP